MVLAENDSTHTHSQREIHTDTSASEKKLLIGKENENNETKRPK